jgi:NTE family protein
VSATRIGLVLGAGGVVGHAWHAGVLQALEEETGFDPRAADVVVGTSAGAVGGAARRAAVATTANGTRDGGPTFERGRRSRVPSMAAPGVLLRSALQPWNARLGVVSAAVLPVGRIPTEPVVGAFRERYGNGWPQRPLYLNAVRLDTGRRVTFGAPGAPTADVASAVAASIAIPGFFAPVTINGVRYVDGGAHSPTNADVVAREPLDLVVVSSPMSMAGNDVRPAPDLGARRLARLYLAREVARLRRHGMGVLVFQPRREDRSVMGLNAMDAERAGRVMQQAARSARDRIARSEVRAHVDALRDAVRRR